MSVRAHTASPSANRDFVRVGRSRIHGKGVFAKRRIPRGTRVIEYAGARVPVTQLFVEMAEGAPPPVYSIRLNETMVIDGARGGNDARFINHSCDPNCEAYVFDDHVYIYAMREIARGEELTFDYKLGAAFGRRRRKGDLDAYACACGSPKCRGTMIARRVYKRQKPRSGAARNHHNPRSK